MKKLFLACTCILSLSAYSQHCVHFTLIDLSAKKTDSVFIAGDFNDWNPHAKKYMLTQKEKGKWEVTLLLPNGPQNYKFTQGSWDIAEANSVGEAAGNRNMNADKETLRNDTVSAWTDKKAAKPREHTASANVHIIDTAFYIPSLKRTRRIWIYLPAGYYLSSGLFPVLYMQDGQNLFDSFTSGFGEWGIDEALDTLQQKTGRCIVVGIDHGGNKRMTEYDPYDNEKYGREEGDAYVDFLVNTLKPFIDKNYLTERNPAHTAIAGSSMGGLISAYAVLKYPNVFGAAGIFSPSFWIAPVYKDLAAKSKIENPNLRFWFYAGEKESEHMVPDMQAVKDIIASRYKTDIAFSTDPDASHNETAWRKWFPKFYLWWVGKL